MTNRRHQALTAALSGEGRGGRRRGAGAAGRLDEPAVRRVAHWLVAASGAATAG
ncbi:hypothetical protein [Streptomyces sp. KHY 26]|uniref:hypothetical protein n=1 Tax=Streptomyces sp. KHY 26 TaxID=3097359 RepID=UPI00376EC6F9